MSIIKIIGTMLIGIFIISFFIFFALKIYSNIKIEKPENLNALLKLLGNEAQFSLFAEANNINTNIPIIQSTFKKYKDITGAEIVEVHTIDNKLLRFSNITGQLLNYGDSEQIVSSTIESSKELTVDCHELIAHIMKIINIDLIRHDETSNDVGIKLYEKPSLCSSDNQDLKSNDYILNQNSNYLQFCFCRTYKGFESQSFILVRINKFTNKVFQIVNFPFIIPDDTSINISKEDATAIALKFAKNKRITYKDYRINQLIIQPNNFYSYLRISGFRFYNYSRLCWIIILEPNNTIYDKERCIFVDCSTGKIVGGN